MSSQKQDKTIAVPPEVQVILNKAKEHDGISKKLLVSVGVKTLNEWFLQNKAELRLTGEAISSREMLNALREKARADGASIDELAEIDKGIEFFEGILQKLRNVGVP